MSVHIAVLRVLWRRHRLQICQGRKACGMLVAEMPKRVRAVMEAIHSSLSLGSYFFTMISGEREVIVNLPRI